ncbi:thioredoxin-dependent thiol peroxidase [Blochmannia endosymbiont of Camponotus sp. C-003]|uniref:thioredoxin-dependent thiol peroxidase n=1 Tax=unclassified Candidatus Blochmanniella TaxID=711328 RepID=UPI0020248302|nr:MULTISPECIES: thioredoxin-dependent thiol peroxidase [unclassified Candidatus Blochmannia]URJ23318.1 thioredoxin-dependent thiol peroxidase [Blochmannia endosymbiont of Camponotus sp. C-003]URJ28791.1 thioredoxin-dependent thiol peroxidase [Blochmannia endosymbiont of Camponotus sp. C-046]
MIPLQIGDTAPQFNLPDQNGVLISLNSFIGIKKILVYFFPKAMTPGCTIQACKLRDNMHAFRKLNIEIIGISNDTSEKLAKFSEKEMLNFTLLTDENNQIAKKFGVWGEKKFMGKPYNGIHRVSFIINQTGMIEQVFQHFKPVDHDQIVLRYLIDNN